MTGDKIQSGHVDVPTEENAAVTYEVGNDESLTEAIVTLVSSLRAIDPTEMQPLYTVVDLEALTGLVEPAHLVEGRSDIVATFTYARCDVTVQSNGLIAVSSLGETKSTEESR